MKLEVSLSSIIPSQVRYNRACAIHYCISSIAGRLQPLRYHQCRPGKRAASCISFVLIDCSLEHVHPRLHRLCDKDEAAKSGLVCSSQGTFPIEDPPDVTLPESSVLTSLTEVVLRWSPCATQDTLRNTCPILPLIPRLTYEQTVKCN
jgi:hypothetical protein